MSDWVSKGASGYAYAGFICGAADCYETYETDLISDGYYPYFDTHDGWHIELSVIVRCPAHCEFIGTSLAAGGHWKDSP